MKPVTEPELRMMAKRGTDYVLQPSDAEFLKGVSGLPLEFREKALAYYVSQNGPDALLRLFAGFIGLSNSVVLNCREFLEMAGIIHGNMGPYEVEKLNLPTIFGALQGACIAVKPVRGMCGGCAYRRGTAANQSPCTTFDAHDSATGAIPNTFMCHENLDAKGGPTKTCKGWATFLRQDASGDRNINDGNQPRARRKRLR